MLVGSIDGVAWGGGGERARRMALRGSTRPPLPRGALIWLLGLAFGIVAGAASLYLIAGGSTASAAAAPPLSADAG